MIKLKGIGTVRNFMKFVKAQGIERTMACTVDGNGMRKSRGYAVGNYFVTATRTTLKVFEFEHPEVEKWVCK